MRTASLIAAFVVLASAAEAGELVVTKSTVPGLDVGTIIDGADKLSLRDGHRLSLIAPSGRVINLVGPYEGVPDASTGGPREEKLITTIATLMSGHGRDASQLGATRNAAERRAGKVWTLDVGMGGAQCVRQGEAPTLWQPDASAARPTEVAKVGGGRARIAWPKGEAVAPWPRQMPVEDGATYQLGSTSVTLHIIPQTSNPAELAAALTEKGCEAQALAALSTAQ
jgi:hypothetical protein